MLRLACTALTATLITLGSGDWMTPVIPASRVADHASACNHYENRARFKPRDGRIEFVTLMAEACAGARTSLATGSHAEKLAAVDLLDRILRLRDTVVEINTTRIYGADASAWAQPRDSGMQSGRMRQLGSVTASGEVLIAHRLGLFSAYDAWRATGAEFSLASALH